MNLAKTNKGKHGRLIKVPVKETYIAGMSDRCARNTFTSDQNAFVREVFIKKSKSDDIWANDRLYIDVYECANDYEASLLNAKIDSFQTFRYKGRTGECTSNDSIKGYSVSCCDVLFSHGSYIKFQYQNVIIVLVDDSGRNPIFRNIKNDFQTYFKND